VWLADGWVRPGDPLGPRRDSWASLARACAGWWCFPFTTWIAGRCGLESQMREYAVVPGPRCCRIAWPRLLARVAKCQLSGETAHGGSTGTGFPNTDVLAYLGFRYYI